MLVFREYIDDFNHEKDILFRGNIKAQVSKNEDAQRPHHRRIHGKAHEYR